MISYTDLPICQHASTPAPISQPLYSVLPFKFSSAITSNSPVSQRSNVPAIGLAPTRSCPICLLMRGAGLRDRVLTTNSLAEAFSERAFIMGGWSERMVPTSARQSVITFSIPKNNTEDKSGC